MSKVVTFGRDLPCLKPKRRPKNLYQLTLHKSWTGHYVVLALDASRSPLLEKSFDSRHLFDVWCANNFRERLFPSDIAAMVDIADLGETADFPIRARGDALIRYDMKEPLQKSANHSNTRAE